MNRIFSEIFSRDPSNRFPALDGIRALAITSVVFFHGFLLAGDSLKDEVRMLDFIRHLPWWLQWTFSGHYAVDLFLVLSGFLLSYALFSEYHDNNGINLRWFYAKRMLRIYPLYVLILFLIVMGDHSKLRYSALSLFALNNIIDAEKYRDLNWLIAIEIQFYLVCPYLVMFLSKSKRALLWLGAFLLAAFAWRWYFIAAEPRLYNQTLLEMLTSKNYDIIQHYWKYIYVSTISRAPALICGITASWLWFFRRQEVSRFFNEKISPNFFSAFIVLALFSLFSFNAEWTSGMDFTGSAARFFYTVSLVCNSFFISALASLLMLLVFACSGGNCRICGFLSAPALFPVAKVSYSVYLFHLGFLYIFRTVIFGKDKVDSAGWPLVLLNILLGGLFAFAFGILTYALIERRFLSGKINLYFRGRFAGHRTPEMPPPA